MLSKSYLAGILTITTYFLKYLHEKNKYMFCLRLHTICILFLFIITVFLDKVNDPMMAVQIAWMMEVPEVYQQCYDKPFKLQPNASG